VASVCVARTLATSVGMTVVPVVELADRLGRRSLQMQGETQQKTRTLKPQGAASMEKNE
jgi:hypothetical protein